MVSLLIQPRTVQLTRLAPSFTSSRMLLDPLTAKIAVRLRRPRADYHVDWTASQLVQANLIVRLDGTEHRCTGHAIGGMGISDMVLTYTLPHGFFGRPRDGAKRLGELGRIVYDARIELGLLGGGATSLDVDAWTIRMPSPTYLYHSSVAFDAATSAEQFSGSGTLSWSHTASGSDRAVFMGCCNYRETDNTGILNQTYPGTGATAELWDAAGPATDPAKLRTAGWYRVAPSTGAQTASFDSDVTDPTYKAGGVISMTGVHQTTPVGTHVTGNGLTSAASVTVTDAVSGDLVVDVLTCICTAATPPTIGANQTERNAQDVFYDPSAQYFRQSTQNGSDGGVMSWTATDINTSYGWNAGAVAFKAADGAPASTVTWVGYIG